MKRKRKILGLLSVLVGALASQSLYALSDDGSVWNTTIFLMMLPAAAISFVAFTCCRFAKLTKERPLLFGAIISYSMMLIMVLVGAGVTGDYAETLMWMPIIVLAGVAYMAPVVGMSWLRNELYFGGNLERLRRQSLRRCPCGHIRPVGDITPCPQCGRFHCPKCQYNIEHVDHERCPECGEETRKGNPA